MASEKELTELIDQILKLDSKKGKSQEKERNSLFQEIEKGFRKIESSENEPKDFFYFVSSRL